MAGLRCNSCGKRISGAKLYYRVRATVTSEPSELEFTEEDMAGDHEAELERLSRAISEKHPQELEDEVFVLLDYFLCVKCKKSYTAKVRRGPA